MLPVTRPPETVGGNAIHRCVIVPSQRSLGRRSARRNDNARLGLVSAMLFGIVVLQLPGCASDPGVTAAEAQIPALPAGMARVWVLRQFEPGLGVQWSPMTYVNGAPLAPALAGTAFYRDLAPGTYTFTVYSCTRDFSQAQTLQLRPAQSPISKFRSSAASAAGAALTRIRSTSGRSRLSGRSFISVR